jgi:mono/diheme cytochrome c family protein
MGRNAFLLAILALVLGTMACRLFTGGRENQQVEKAPAGQISGAKQYDALGCASCHEQAAGIVAPSLEGLYGQEVQLEGGEVTIADEAYLRESILSPKAKVVAGYEPVMPDFSNQVTEEELAALIDFLRSLAD